MSAGECAVRLTILVVFLLISSIISETRQVPAKGCSLGHLDHHRRRVPNSYAVLQICIDVDIQCTENNAELFLHRPIKHYVIFQYNLIFFVTNNMVYNKN